MNMTSPDLEQFEKCISELSIGGAVMLTYSIENPKIIYANKKHELLTGYKAAEIAGKNPKIFQGRNTSRKTIEDMISKLSSSDFWDGDIVNYTKFGREYIARLTIFGIKLDGEKYYVAIKRNRRESWTDILFGKFKQFWKF